MGGIHVEVSEPVNVLSTMLLARYGLPKGAKPHRLAALAYEHTRPFDDHPSLSWLAEFIDPTRLHPLYGHVVRLAGPMSFVPRDVAIPTEIGAWEPERMAELPKRMAAFYADAKLGTFRRANNAAYTLMEAEVKDAVGNARIDEFLSRLFGPVRERLVVIPVPTHLVAGGSTAAQAGSDAFALLHPPDRSPSDPVEWSYRPETTQVVTLEAFTRTLLRRRRMPDRAFTPAAAAAFLRYTRGDEAAQRWLDELAHAAPIPGARELFLAINEFLDGRRGRDLRALVQVPA